MRNHNTVFVDSRDVIEKYRNAQQGCSDKPKGIWYAFGDTWLKWVKDECPEIIGYYPVRYEVDITSCNVLKIDSLERLVAFTMEFQDIHSFGSNPCGVEKVDWKFVAECYDGIEINPVPGLSYGLDKGVLWLASWDFASGCIWNVDKIGLKRIE